MNENVGFENEKKGQILWLKKAKIFLLTDAKSDAEGLRMRLHRMPMRPHLPGGSGKSKQV